MPALASGSHANAVPEKASHGLSTAASLGRRPRERRPSLEPAAHPSVPQTSSRPQGPLPSPPPADCPDCAHNSARGGGLRRFSTPRLACGESGGPVCRKHRRPTRRLPPSRARLGGTRAAKRSRGTVPVPMRAETTLAPMLAVWRARLRAAGLAVVFEADGPALGEHVPFQASPTPAILTGEAKDGKGDTGSCRDACRAESGYGSCGPCIPTRPPNKTRRAR